MSDELINSDAMYRSLLKIGEEWADAKSAYQALDDATSTVLADLTQFHRSGDISRAEAETVARASTAYKDHLVSVAAANKHYLRAQVKYDSLKMLVELRRSEESSRRAEMRL